MKFNRTLLSVSLIAGLIGFIFGWQLALISGEDASAVEKNGVSIKVDGKETNLNRAVKIPVIDQISRILQESYYKPAKLDEKEMGYGAARGFVEAIDDRYTVYMDPEESKDFSDGLEGVLEGIGAELELQEGKLIIVRPLKDSPAQRAGIRPGDLIFKINGEETLNLSVVEAVKRIRGPKGTQVVLTIIRAGAKAPFEVAIRRDSIHLESVRIEELKDGIFHVSLIQFNDTTKKEFSEAIEKILLERGQGMILDVRGNGGGFLDISIDILSELIAGQQNVVIVRERGKPEQFLKTNGNARLPDIPMIVLIDKGSASASEIVAGAIQDLKRGIAIGEKTFGKGTVQEIMSRLNDGGSIRFTVAEWFTPSDRSISEQGITPDIEVLVSDEELKAGKDPQLDEAAKYLQQLLNQ